MSPMKHWRLGVLVLAALAFGVALRPAYAAAACLSISGGGTSPATLGTTLSFTAQCCTAAPALADYWWVLGVLLLVAGMFIVGRAKRLGAGTLLLGFALLFVRPAHAASCGGPFQWRAQSANELFTGTAASFSFTPLLPGTFAITLSDPTESASPVSVQVVSSEAVTLLHKSVTRDGVYIEPTLTKAVAASMHLDSSFAATVSGNVYAQPLYVPNGPGGKGTFIVATESNVVSALAEADGNTLWTRTVETPANATGAGCGNIAPLGITGTPAIDLPSRTIFLDAVAGNTSTILQHKIHALSLDDGSERTGYPVDPTSITSGTAAFNPVVQNERGAALIANGILYVGYGGHAGDCGNYNGWVVGVPLSNPSGIKAWATGIKGGGIWGVGGLASDGTDVFAATGNTFGATTWAQGNAILRFHGLPSFSNQTTDYFAPSNWQSLDAGDIDLGSSGPLIVDVPGATPSKLVVALGKSGVAYLLNRANLGGLGSGNGTTGEGLVSVKVATSTIMNAAATYTTALGVHVVFNTTGTGVGCPAGQAGNLVSLLLGAASPPSVSVAWCADNQGRGSPIVTTTDGRAESVVWAVGASSSNRLHGFDGDTGAVVFAGGGSGDVIAGVQNFSSPIAVNGRIVVGANNALFAFKSP
jgi:hypothetical protein